MNGQFDKKNSKEFVFTLNESKKFLEKDSKMIKNISLFPSN